MSEPIVSIRGVHKYFTRGSEQIDVLNDLYLEVKEGEYSAYGRELESTQDAEKLAQMEKDGRLTTHEFREREQLLELAEPVKQAYAEELGAADVLEAVNQIQ